MTIHLANAPVSYGVFELTVGSDRFLAPAEWLLDEVAAAGYTGIDLGPVGYLGAGSELGRRLEQRGLGLSGGYVELSFHDPVGLQRDLAALDAVLEAFDAAGAAAGAADGEPGPRPLPTLAAAGSAAHRARPGGAAHDRSVGLGDDAWPLFAEGLRIAVERCRARGYEPTFHPHIGSYVEAPWEIERVLALSDVGLCLDTGHVLAGGGDPVALLREVADRVNHVHLKDADMAVMHEIVAAGEPSSAVWTRRVFCPLGRGDLDLDGFLRALAEVGYDGWVVVEQDALIADEAGYLAAVADQRANRALLAAAGL